MRDRVFGVLQRVGRSFMLPIALLPVAGLLLGIGSSFTNQTMLEAYGLTGIIYEGNILYTILEIMSRCGSAVFDNLPLLFAMGVAIGMARQEKEVAALSGAIAYLVMNTAIGALIVSAGGVEAMPPNATTSTLGILTLQMGVFGGILVGLGVAALHNRFYKTELPPILSFFGGTRFVPIVCTAVYLVVGVLMFFLWPVVQGGISLLGDLVVRSGYLGTGIYGLIERALIPFGLHHVFYMPFWQTALGGSAVVDGTLVQGAQNIFFAELASKHTAAFSVEATRFMAGKFPFMIFGLAGAALAMYRCARPEKKQAAGGLLLSAALTAMLTGITEPLEFTFLFVAPLMYAVHCLYAGLSYLLMHLLNVGVGMTFSGGLIDLTLFGILQGNAKTNWIWVVLVGIPYFFLYYGTFLVMIRTMDLPTPGREAGEETRLFTRADLQSNAADSTAALILRGLGGRENISDVDCCATRLRITVADEGRVDDRLLKQSGASGVIHRGNGIQIVYGPRVAVIKSELVDFMGASQPDRTILHAPVSGRVVRLADVPDEAFSQGTLGDGLAIEPEGDELLAPADGVIEMVFDSGHAVTMTTDRGVEVLMHIGIDTIQLKGQHFAPQVQAGQRVKTGQLLIRFDREAIARAGYPLTTPVVVCSGETVSPLAEGAVQAGDHLFEVVH